MKLLHTADWQLGARFAQFGDKADLMRQARLDTLEKALRLAREEKVDAFIAAGDLFDDNHVEESLVTEVVKLFRAYESVPVFILPGNHDPYTGPGCVWEREVFQAASANVHVFKDAEAIEFAGGYLVASPLRQKLSTVDPSLKLDELVSDLPTDAIKVGITHGSMDIPSKRQDNDFPINVEAATRVGLSYLAIGHWHGWQTFDQEKIVMPGTPEPDDFAQTNSGFAALVEIDGAGHAKVEQRRVATLTWQHSEIDLADLDRARQRLDDDFAPLDTDPSNAIARVTLSGRADSAELKELTEWLTDRTKDFAFFQLRDKSTLTLSEAALKDLRERSPLLAQVFADLDRIESMVGSGDVETEISGGDSNLTLDALQGIADAAGIEMRALTPEHINAARNLILQHLPENNQ